MIAVRPCGPEDLAVLRELSCSTFRETFASSNTPENLQAYLDRAYGLERLRAELAERESEFYFAELDGDAVGYLKLNEALAQTEFQDPASLEVERIYVRRRAQGMGLGRTLLQHAVSSAAARGKRYIWLGVWEHNSKAMRFYQKNGFYRISEHSFFVGDDEQTDIILRKDL